MLSLKVLKKKENGQAIVEMALVLPILIILLFGIIEFGRVLNTYMIVTNLSREGARAGAVGNIDTAITSSVETWANAAGLDTNLLSVTITPTSITKRNRGDSVMITVSYPVEIYAPVIGAIIGDPYNVSSGTTMRVEG